MITYDTNLEKQSGFSFDMIEYPKLRMLYLNMCDESLENVLDNILDADPDIKRELGLEDLIG